MQNSDWQSKLQEKLPLLGHRNWIVITDMAYPLQEFIHRQSVAEYQIQMADTYGEL